MRITSCGVAELADFIGSQRLTLPRGVYAHHLVQVTTGQARAVYADDDAAPLAIAGLYAWGDGRPAQVWFMVRRDAARRRIAGIAAGLRAALRAQARGHHGEIVTLVDPGNRAGEVLARFLGFAPTALVGEFGQIWLYGGEHGERGEGAVRPERRGEGAAAPDPGAAAQARQG
jgi:hypothetical protein